MILINDIYPGNYAHAKVVFRDVLHKIEFAIFTNPIIQFILGGLFALKQWISSSLNHDTDPRVNNLYSFYVKKKQKTKQNALHYGNGTGANRPFPSSCLPPLQSESKCEVFVMVIGSTLHMNEN